MIKAEFSASLLQSSVSHEYSEIIVICWFDAQKKKKKKKINIIIYENIFVKKPKYLTELKLYVSFI